MPVIHYVAADGTSRRVEAEGGTTLMKAAVSNDIPGIYGDCGGVCACATCHIYVAEDWLAVVGEAGESERELLEISDDVRPNSRLGCQIVVEDRLDGLVVTVPDS